MARQMVFRITPEYDSMKLYTYLKQVRKMSTSTIRSLKHLEGGITLNGSYIRTVDFLHTGDTLTLTFPEENNQIEPTSDRELAIVYEDEDILVINKPAFLAMHPTHNHQGDTLANQVAAHLQKKDGNCLFRAVGRLDKCTSGLVLCGLNRHSAAALQGHTNKEYLAVAGGHFENSGTVNKPICRPDPTKTLRAVGENGEKAVTHWQALSSNGSATLLRIRLETGRTHQIRVHFASMNAPLLGDDMYGSLSPLINRAALHCESLSFLHPVTGEKMFFSVPMPEDMQNLCRILNLINS